MVDNYLSTKSAINPLDEFWENALRSSEERSRPGISAADTELKAT